MRSPGASQWAIILPCRSRSARRRRWTRASSRPACRPSSPRRRRRGRPCPCGVATSPSKSAGLSDGGSRPAPRACRSRPPGPAAPRAATRRVLDLDQLGGRVDLGGEVRAALLERQPLVLLGLAAGGDHERVGRVGRPSPPSPAARLRRASTLTWSSTPSSAIDAEGLDALVGGRGQRGARRGGAAPSSRRRARPSRGCRRSGRSRRRSGRGRRPP